MSDNSGVFDPIVYSVAADVVLVVHFAFVLFVVFGLVLVWIGYFASWNFVRGIVFRLSHLLAMVVVVLESVFGIICPLTTWENRLRHLAGGGERYESSFMQHWIHKVMFFDLEPSTFTVIYVVFLLALVLSFVVVRPRWPSRPRA